MHVLLKTKLGMFFHGQLDPACTQDPAVYCQIPFPDNLDCLITITNYFVNESLVPVVKVHPGEKS